MSAATKGIAIGVLVLLAGGAGGGFYLYRKSGETQKTKREQAFADVSQCLFGERVEAPDTAATAMTGMQARGAHLADAARWPESGIAWPQRCASNAEDLIVAVRESSFLEAEPKRILLKEADALLTDLKKPDAQAAFLQRSVVALWRAAEQNQLRMAASSTVVGPPPTVRAGISFDALELPFANILPVENGPVWHFLATRKGKKDALATCVPTETGLSCKEFKSDDAFLPRGTWDSAAYIPQTLEPSLRVLVDGKLEDPGLPNPNSVHVDDKGTVYALVSSYDTDKSENVTKIHIKPRDKEAIVVRVDKAAAKHDLKDVLPLQLVGQGLVARALSPKERVLRFPIAADGTFGAPKEIPGMTFCRAGQRYVFSAFEGERATLVFLEGDTLGNEVNIPKTEDGAGRTKCSASGAVQIGARILCRTTGCIEVFDDAGFTLFMKNVQTKPIIDMVGDRIVYTWGAKDGSGLLVHVGDPGFTAAGKDVLVVDKTGGKGPQQMGVFGSDKFALAIAEVEDKLVGFVINANGEVSAAKVDWK